VKTYEQWLRRFLRFHLLRHPREMGSAEVNASTQNQALAALLFLYRDVLETDLELEGLVRARTRRRLPVVLTPEEVRLVLERLTGAEALVAGLLYGSGLRLMEALRLRVQDLDFGRRELTVRDGKGASSSSTCGRCVNSTSPTWPRATAGWNCPMPWPESTPTPLWNGVGSGFFRSSSAGAMPTVGSRGDITWIPA